MNNFYLDEINEQNYIQALEHNYEKKEILNVKKYEQATVLPAIQDMNDLNHTFGGLITSDGQYVENSGIRRYGTWKYIYGKYDFDNNNVQYIDKDVYYIGMFIKHWGHFLLESTTRLWYLIHLNDEEKKKMTFVYFGTKLKKNYLEFFNLLGIHSDQLLYIDSPTKFKSVLVPDVASELTCFYTKEFNEVFDYIAAQVPADKYKKIYFTRTQFCRTGDVSQNECRGEEEIEKIFRKNGYKIFAPEQLTLKKQIALIKGCQEFASLNSSNSHNLIFANKDCRACLVNKCNIVNYTQILINQMRNIKASYVDAGKNFLPVSQGMGPFLVYPSEHLKQYCIEHNLDFKNVKQDISDKDIVWYFSYWGMVNNEKWVQPHIQNANFEECLNLMKFYLPYKSNFGLVGKKNFWNNLLCKLKLKKR